MDDTDLTDRIKAVLIRVLDLPIGPEQLHDDTSLYSPLIQMDSQALLQLLVTFESDLGVVIDDEDVMAADFTTVSSLTTLVRVAEARAQADASGPH